MSFWKTLAALFVHDIGNDIVKAKEDAKKDADALKADQRIAYTTYAPRCRASEAKILNDFNTILEKTYPGKKDIHEQREFYLRLVEALPYLVAIDGGGDIYESSKRYLNEKVETSYSFSGAQLRNLYAQRNTDKWWKYESIIGLDITQGSLWKDMLSLKVKDNSSTIQNLVTILFNDVIECIDNIAHLAGEWYQYATSDITANNMRSTFNELIHESITPDYCDDNSESFDKEDCAIYDKQISAAQSSIQKMMNTAQTIFGGNNSKADNEGTVRFFSVALLKYTIDQIDFSNNDRILVLDDCIGKYFDNNQFQAKLIYEPPTELKEYSELFDTFPREIPVALIKGAIQKGNVYLGMNFLPDAAGFIKSNEEYITSKYQISISYSISDQYFNHITKLLEKELESLQ